MDTVFASPFQTIFYDRKAQIIKVLHYENSFEMSDDDYRHYMLAYIACIRKYQPKRFLVNNKKLFYTVYPEIQDWVNNLFLSVQHLIEHHYLAVVISEDFYVKVSVEQLLEDTKCILHRKYFDKEEDAYQWLLTSSVVQVGTAH